MNRFILVAVATLALTATTDARAQRAGRPATSYSGAGENLLTPWLVLDPGSPAGVGLGVRYLLPVVPEGLLTGQLRGIREELDVEFGADFLHWSYDVTYPYIDPVTFGLTYRTDTYGVSAFDIVGGLLWNWWLTPKVAVYPKLDLGYRYAWLSNYPSAVGGSGPSFSEVFVEGAAGVMFKLDKVALRLEAGSHTVKLGAGFVF